VLSQTFEDIEVIVYDDCSPENLRTIVGEFGDRRLSYTRNEKNLGTFANTNQAMDLCDTEYINIFHGDDKMFPWMVERLLKCLDKNKTVGIAASSRQCEMGSRRILLTRRFGGGTLYGKDELIEKTNRHRRNLVVCPSMTFRKSVIDGANLRFRPNIGPAADMFMAFEANHKGVEIYCSRAPLLETRVHAKSWTARSDAEQWSASLKKVDDYLTGLELGFDIDGIREYMAKMDILTLSRDMSDNDDLSSLLSRRKYLEREMGWFLRDGLFNDAVSIGYLGKCLMSAKNGKLPADCYGEKLLRMREHGIDVPFVRRLKWFINYGVWA
jgi:glycosyltransferase involved in cell wall biosynthesis